MLNPDASSAHSGSGHCGAPQLAAIFGDWILAAPQLPDMGKKAERRALQNASHWAAKAIVLGPKAAGSPPATPIYADAAKAYGRLIVRASAMTGGSTKILQLPEKKLTQAELAKTLTDMLQWQDVDDILEKPALRAEAKKYAKAARQHMRMPFINGTYISDFSDRQSSFVPEQRWIFVNRMAKRRHVILMRPNAPLTATAWVLKEFTQNKQDITAHKFETLSTLLHEYGHARIFTPTANTNEKKFMNKIRDEASAETFAALNGLLLLRQPQKTLEQIFALHLDILSPSSYGNGYYTALPAFYNILGRRQPAPEKLIYAYTEVCVALGLMGADGLPPAEDDGPDFVYDGLKQNLPKLLAKMPALSAHGQDVAQLTFLAVAHYWPELINKNEDLSKAAAKADQHFSAIMRKANQRLGHGYAGHQPLGLVNNNLI